MLAACSGGGNAESTGTAGGEACWPDDGVEPDPEFSRMGTWGAPCETDAQCVELIGEGAICMEDAVIYEMPGGYCSKPCSLPDDVTTFVLDAPDCDPAGGVLCVGADGFFERCVLECTAAEHCDRDGYFCRLMPLIGAEGDPRICMMDDCCEDDCDSG